MSLLFATLTHTVCGSNSTLEGSKKELTKKLALVNLLPHSTEMRARPLTFVCFHYVNGVNTYSQIANRKAIIFF